VIALPDVDCITQVGLGLAIGAVGGDVGALVLVNGVPGADGMLLMQDEPAVPRLILPTCGLGWPVLCPDM
jgi:hypothetical protein